MFDTVGLSWDLEEVGEAELRSLSRVCPMGLWQSQPLTKSGAPGPRVWGGTWPGVGTPRLSERGWLSIERSLAKVYQELVEGVAGEESDNCAVLSCSQAVEAVRAWGETVERSLPVVPESFNVRRVDLVYDRRVPSSAAAVASLLEAVKPTRKGAAIFASREGIPCGIMFKGRKVVHRVYDKGVEQQRRDLYNVLRSEEQLRTGSVGFARIVDSSSRSFDRQAAVEVLNERYLGYVGEALDVRSLLESQHYQVALYVLHPELLTDAREFMERKALSKLRRRVREVRARSVPVDLRIPEDAWEG